MRSHVRLGRVFGVEIGLHYSWVLIALLIAFTLAGHFEAMHPDWGAGVIWASSILTAVLFFVALTAHELSHALVARAHRLPVKSITLFALGGVAQIEKDPQDARTEFWMAIVGPIASAVIGAGCLFVAWTLGWPLFSTPDSPPASVLVWLGYINLSLAAFNMIPGFPLDGGRVLHAILWWITKKADKSLRIAAQVGRIVALLFIALGVGRFFMGAGFGALWMAFIGWFLLDAAGSSYAQMRILEVLRGLRVRDLMVRDCPTVNARENLREFVEEAMTREGRPCWLAEENGRILGIISPREIRDIPRAQWPYRTVYDVMIPVEDMHAITPETPVMEALERMGRENVNQLPVASEGRLEGIISRAAVLGFVQKHAHLRV
jgi:Zn-dependent protease